MASFRKQWTGAEIRTVAVSAEGGELQPLGLAMEGLLLYGLSVHPDGRRIAFTAGQDFGSQTWVMENLLPGLKAAK